MSHLITTEEERKWLDQAQEYLDLFGKTNKQIDEGVKRAFLSFAAASKLNPFKNEIYLVPFSGGKYSVFVSYHVYLRRAWASGEIEFLEVASALRNPENPDHKNNLYAQVTIKRKGMEQAAKVYAYIEDYSTNTGKWINNYKMMLEKCAVVKALRLYFADYLDLPYAEEENWDKPNEPIQIQIQPTPEFNFISDELVKDDAPEIAPD